MLPLGGIVRTLGRCILLMALPLAVEGARQAFKERVIYVSCSDTLLIKTASRVLRRTNGIYNILMMIKLVCTITINLYF